MRKSVGHWALAEDAGERARPKRKGGGTLAEPWKGGGLRNKESSASTRVPTYLRSLLQFAFQILFFRMFLLLIYFVSSSLLEHF